MPGRGFSGGKGKRRGRRWKRRGRRRRRPLSLADLREGESGIIESLELPAEVSHRLMELGFIPGSEIEAGKTAPGGDPRVFRVDGSEIALRRETAQRLLLRTPEGPGIDDEDEVE